jgi:hypothetical protein
MDSDLGASDVKDSDVGGAGSDRCLVRATATRWVADQPFPGVVEVEFTEHNGSVVTIREKCAVIDRDLSKATSYPAEVLLLAEIIAVSTPAWAVRLLHGVEDIKGRTDFTVSWSLVVDGAPEARPRRPRFLP